MRTSNLIIIWIHQPFKSSFLFKTKCYNSLDVYQEWLYWNDIIIISIYAKGLIKLYYFNNNITSFSPYKLNHTNLELELKTQWNFILGCDNNIKRPCCVAFCFLVSILSVFSETMLTNFCLFYWPNLLVYSWWNVWC